MSSPDAFIAEARAPDGFGPIRLPGDTGFTPLAGPWFARIEDGRLVGGFRVLGHHLNPQGACHGGMIATFCDVFLAIAAVHQCAIPARMLPTVSLSLDFLVPIPAGAWVEGRSEVLRRGRRLVFAQGLLAVDGRPVVRANGVFSVPQTPEAGGSAEAG